MTELEEPPLLGALTRTLIKSPVIKSILPARIRHSSLIDLILVGCDSVEIKQVIPVYVESLGINDTKYHTIENVYLKDITVKEDFDSNIRSARIFGNARIYGSTDDSVIKSEGTRSSEAPSLPRPQLPPQFLALTLESSKIVFLCAFYNFSGELKWLSSYRPLPNYGPTYSKQLGEHLAVDPESRAMAVAANEGSFMLYSLRSVDELRQEIDPLVGHQSCNFDPVKDERLFHIDGVVLKMEFLHPPKNEDDEVVLLVLISKNQKTKLHCYVWDKSTDLRQALQRGSGQSVPDSDQLPLLLIPLMMSTSFMLVFQQHMTIYTGILTGPAIPYTSNLRHSDEPEEPGASRGLPLFTQWTRPLRHNGHVSFQDNIYLCREDGVVRFLEIGDSISDISQSSNDVGRLKVNIDTAFASLDLGTDAPDVLVVGGDMSDGGLWFFGPRTSTSLTFTLPNWTPTIDFAMMQQPALASFCAQKRSTQRQPRVFASTGRDSRHGEITEIRYGIRGEIVHYLDPVDHAVTQVWALHNSTGTGVYILISSPTDTTPLFISAQEGELSDADTQLEIILDARTIAAGRTIDGCMIQVTASKFVVTSTVDPRRSLVTSFEDGSVTSACVLTTFRHGSIILTTVERETGNYLQCARISTDDEKIISEQIGEPVKLAAQSSFSSLQQIRGNICAFIGSISGALQVYAQSSSADSRLCLIAEHNFEGEFAICDSIAMLVGEDRHWLVCGLRNGTCKTLSVEVTGQYGIRFHSPEKFDPQLIILRSIEHYFLVLTSLDCFLTDTNSLSEEALKFKSLESFALGNLSVNVQVDQSRKNRALITCEDVFTTLEYSSEQAEVATMHNIFLTDYDRPGYKQKCIVAFTQAAVWYKDGDPVFAAGQWFCVQEGSFDLVDLQHGSEAAMVPRRLHLDGTPSRVKYSEYLQKLIVLYTRIEIRRDPRHGQPGQRAIIPSIIFLDPDQELVRPDANDAANNELRTRLTYDQMQRANIVTPAERKAGERFLGFTEWFPTEGSNRYNMLVIFTMITYVYDRAPTGRLLFFSLFKNANNGQVAMAFKKITELKAPVYAVVPYGQSSLIYSCGNDICLHTLKLAEPRDWLPPVIVTLQSRSVHISVSGHLVYITTAAASLSVLKVGDDNRSMKLLYGDERARDGIFHVDIPERDLVITSSKDGTITGLQRPPQQRISNSMPTAFTTEFSGSLTRLRRVPQSSWRWSESSKEARSKVESIIACTADGSFYQIDILEEATWRFLRFIANMARRHPVISPFRERYSGLIDAKHVGHIEPSTANKRFMQVDGDVLNRLLERGPEQLLREMVQLDPEQGSAAMDFNSAEDRERRFWELAREAGVEVSGFSAVVCWMRRMSVRVL